MNNKYEIRYWQDNEWAIFLKGEYGNPLFIGSVEEVNAWLSLKEKGFDF